MSYSRLSHSVWYTYWSSTDDDYDTATFDIWLMGSFTAKELREDLDGCMNNVVVNALPKCNLIPTPEQIEELKGYVAAFLADVEEEYGEKKMEVE